MKQQIQSIISSFRQAIFLAAALLLLVPIPLQADRVVRPLVEKQHNPEGVAVTRPHFSWQITSKQKDVRQTAYCIEVATSREALTDGKNPVWNSGRIESDRSLWVGYAGKPLQSGCRYYWRVTVWTNRGRKLKSDIGYWSTPLAEKDRKAQWIGIDDSAGIVVKDQRTTLPARYLRKEFVTTSKPRRAMLYVSGIGSSYCYLNGRRVGNDVFGPLPMWYDASVPFLTYDVTPLLRAGGNALAVALGNGRYLAMRVGDRVGMKGFGVPRLWAQLEIEYADGSRTTVVSDPSWRVTNRGPVTANNEFDGETYDARKELGSWTTVGYDDSSWAHAHRMAAPRGKLVPQSSPCIKVMEVLKPHSIRRTTDNRYLIDMGQNMAGIPKIRFKAKRGVPVKLRFAEALKEDGNQLYTANLRSALATDTYIPARDGECTWSPAFVYHGYRFVEVSGADVVKDVTGQVIYDEMRTTGTFETSHPLLNRIFKNAYWGIRGNYRGMPTDCPQRDERMGWAGDRTVGAYGESFLFDHNLLYRKWLNDVEESMSAAGAISEVSPRYWTLYHDDVTWPAAYFYVADMLYRQFGDDSSVKARYASMKKWVNHKITTQMKDYILTKDQYGDWCVPPESPELIHSKDPTRQTDGQLLSTSMFYSILQLMQRFATLNDAPGDAAAYAALATHIKEAYNRKFFRAGQACYDNNTVTANLLSLRFGLVPEGYEQQVFANVVAKTEEACNGHVSTGVVGIQQLMRGLTQYGAGNLAYRIATNDTYPSWGYMVRKDATTIWELWNGDTADPAMNSHNHVMLLGDLLIWFYEDLAGIKNDPSGVAFKRILMEPLFPEGLTYTDASYESPYGKITSRWKRAGNRLEWYISIPPNTTATVKVPAAFHVGVQTGLPGIRAVSQRDGKQIIAISSGHYRFYSK